MRAIYIGSYNKSEILSGPEKVCKRIFAEYASNRESLFIEYFQDGKKYNLFKKLFGCVFIGKINESRIMKLGLIKMLIVVFKYKPKYIHILSFNRFASFIFILKLFYPVKIFYNVNGIIAHEYMMSPNKKVIEKYKNILVENIFIYMSDKIFVLSELSKTLLQNYYNTKGIVFVKVMNGLDVCFINRNIKPVEKINSSVVFVGDIDLSYKGFGFLIKALEKLSFEVNLFIIDSSNTKSVSDLPLHINAFFLDKMCPVKLVEFFKDKLIIISPSMFDTFNITVLEAVACGLIPVLTCETGVSEWFLESFQYNTINYGDVNKLRAILEKQLNNPNYNIDLNFDAITWKEVFDKHYLTHYA